MKSCKVRKDGRTGAEFSVFDRRQETKATYMDGPGEGSLVGQGFGKIMSFLEDSLARRNLPVQVDN